MSVTQDGGSRNADIRIGHDAVSGLLEEIVRRKIKADSLTKTQKTGKNYIELQEGKTRRVTEAGANVRRWLVAGCG